MNMDPERQQEDLQYADEEDIRTAVVTVLMSNGYSLDSYTITDKIGEGRARTVTVKATRNLDYIQLSLDNAG